MDRGVAEPRNPADLIHGGPRRWDHLITVAGSLGEPQSGYAVDEITLPHDNPWGPWIRPTGFRLYSVWSAGCGLHEER